MEFDHPLPPPPCIRVLKLPLVNAELASLEPLLQLRVGRMTADFEFPRRRLTCLICTLC